MTTKRITTFPAIQSTPADLKALKQDITSLGQSAVPHMLASKHGVPVGQVKALLRTAIRA